jgi:hypothetical protein
VAIRFGKTSTVKNRLPKYSNFWDGTAVYNPFSPTGSYDALATYTVGSGGASTIEFTGIPTGGQYSHLQLRVMSPSGSYATLRFNNDTTTSNYRNHYLLGTGSGSGSAGSNANAAYFPSSGAWSNPMVGIVDILDYASTSKYKTVRDLEGFDSNGSGEIYFVSALWMSTSAISSIKLVSQGANFGQYSQFSLYGVKG